MPTCTVTAAGTGLSQRNVEPPAHRVMARLDEWRRRAAAVRATPGRLTKTCCPPSPGDRRSHRSLSAVCQPEDDLQGVLLAMDRTRPEGPGDVRADAVDREGAVDVEPRPPGALRRAGSRASAAVRRRGASARRRRCARARPPQLRGRGRASSSAKPTLRLHARSVIVIDHDALLRSPAQRSTARCSRVSLAAVVGSDEHG